jgi:hypothetical protein
VTLVGPFAGPVSELTAGGETTDCSDAGF